MSLGEKIYLYCERGQDPAFWAEPLNAVSNAAFVIAALAAAKEHAALPPEQRSPAAAALIALTAVIGIGSFLFHTYATRWALLADTVPIALFMVAYVAFVLRRFMGLHWIVVGLGVVAFYAAARYAGTIQCSYGELLPVTARAGARCLNGTLAYVPAFLTLLGAAVVLAAHPAGRAMALASVIFLMSMTVRTLDLELCELSRVGGHLRGSHFLWHALNGWMLFILLRAAIRHGGHGPSAPGSGEVRN
jgi:hypothetical protein